MIPARPLSLLIHRANIHPELLNRIDEIVISHPLQKEQLASIVEIQLRRVKQLLADRGYQLDVTPAARAYLAEVGYDADFGARPLKRVIQREVQDPLAIEILSGKVHEGDTLRVDRGKTGLAFSSKEHGELVHAQ